VHLKRLESLVSDLQALDKYDATVESVTKLKNQNSNMQQRLKRADAEISKYKNLKTKYAGQDINLEELNPIILKRIRDTKYEEIERKAQQKFKAEASNLTKKELNRLLTLPCTERPQVLNDLLERKVKENVNVILQTESSWPQEFTQQVEHKISAGISAGLTANHWANVNAAIAQVKRKEWPKYLDQYMHKTITPFCKRFLIEQFINACATQSIAKTCPKCGTVTSYALTQDQISFLFQGAALKGDCLNPQCMDGFLIFKTRHQVQISLADVVAHFVGKPRNPTGVVQGSGGRVR